MEKWNKLPKEIQVNVVKDLPIRDLEHIMESSSSLYSLITSPLFMAGRPPCETGYHIYSCCTSDGKQSFWLCRDSFLTGKFTSRGVPVDVNHSLIGFSSGLACFANIYHIEELTLVVWNPYLGKSLSIPIPLTPGDAKRGCPHALGFGYDAYRLDFKVIKIGILPFDDTCVKGDVYSLFAGTRKTIIGSVRRPVSKVVEQGVYVNGVMHWLMKINPNYLNQGSSNSPPQCGFTILTFDLTKEKFSEMNVDACIAHKNMVLTKLIVSGDEKLVIYHNDKICNVWVMEEYGVDDSWKKFISFDCQDQGYGKVLNSWSDTQIVVWMSSGELKLLNTQYRTMTKLEYNRAKFPVIDYVGPYVTSLVFPKQQPLGE